MGGFIKKKDSFGLFIDNPRQVNYYKGMKNARNILNVIKAVVRNNKALSLVNKNISFKTCFSNFCFFILVLCLSLSMQSDPLLGSSVERGGLQIQQNREKKGRVTPNVKQGPLFLINIDIQKNKNRSPLNMLSSPVGMAGPPFSVDFQNLAKR